MKIDIEIFPYKISQRTEYSKLTAYDMIKEEDVDNNDEVIREIIESYFEQSMNPENFFVIKNNCLTGLADNIDLDKIKYLFIPENVLSISTSAFENTCFELISLPKTINRIPNYCFAGCYKLQCINIPNSVLQIGDHAFYGCAALKEIRLPDIKKIENSTFAYCESLEKINVPDTVEEVGVFAFNGCEALNEIKLPNSITKLMDGAFNYCLSLERVIFSDNLKTIGSYCFRWCTSLKEIYLPDSIEVISDRAFMNCDALEYIKLPKNLQALEDDVFCNCTALKDLFLPDSIDRLVGKCLSYTYGLKEINVPKNLNFISDSVLKKSGITTLIFNHDLPELYMEPSSKKYDLISETMVEKIVISSNVEKISPDVFKYTGRKIKEIDYLGSEFKFKQFEKNNKKFLSTLGEVKVNFIEKNIDKDMEEQVKLCPTEDQPSFN